MKLLFVLMPAIVVGMLFSAILHPVIGLAFAIGLIGLGSQCTEPRSKRGEWR